MVDPYLGKPVSTADLEEIRRQLTLLYIKRGYINSGVIIPDQNVANGVVTFRFVEGRVTDIEVSGTDHFDPEYFRSRLVRGTAPPFNVDNLASEQQILRQDPLVRRLNLELLPGLEPGEARLHADVLEGNRYSLNAQIADDQVPTVGSVRGQLQGSIGNILGFGDILAAQYGRSQGLNDGYVAYSVPIGAITADRAKSAKRNLFHLSICSTHQAGQPSGGVWMYWSITASMPSSRSRQPRRAHDRNAPGYRGYS